MPRARESTSRKSTGFASKGWSATGKLGFSVRGSGTFNDPQLTGNATLNNLAIGGEPVGDLEFVAHTANHALVYDVTTRLDSAELNVHGQTALNGRLRNPGPRSSFRASTLTPSQARARQALSGESALAGTVTVEGPLAHPEQLRGEARLRSLKRPSPALHLKSEGDVHATLANEHIRLDPLHVTGEDTDLRAQGTLALNGTRQLDLAASGSVNLKLAETIDPDLTAAETTTFQVEAHGPLKNPGLQGRVDFTERVSVV